MHCSGYSEMDGGLAVDGQGCSKNADLGPE